MLNGRSKIAPNPNLILSGQVFKILLIIRPGKLLGNLLELELTHEGYKVQVVHDVMSGLLKCQEINPELVVLDWHISRFFPDDLCHRLRSNNSQVGIIVLDTSERSSDRVAALDAGADDSVSVPFAMCEFLARVRVQLRKHMVQDSSILTFEDLHLNTATREVYRGDRYIYLTTKEFNLLKYLITYPRQVLTRVQIIDRVWDYNFAGDSNIIEVYIRYLRLKLEKDNDKRLIHTVRSVGYVLRESAFKQL
ncbi:MAG: response regulator transcription factor [Cyanobacteria bacterium J06621_12]